MNSNQFLPPVPLVALYANGGRTFTVDVPISGCRAFGMQPSNLGLEQHPFVAATRAYIETGLTSVASEVLQSYYDQFVPEDVAALLELGEDHVLSDYPSLGAIFPWDERTPEEQLNYMVECIDGYYQTNNISLNVEDGHAHFGPVAKGKLDLEVKRLVGAYDSIRANGLDPKKGALLGAVLMDDRSGSWVSLILDGLHRIGVLRALGHQSVPVTIVAGEYVQLIRRSDVLAWPGVIKGYFKACEALDVFDRVIAG